MSLDSTMDIHPGNHHAIRFLVRRYVELLTLLVLLFILVTGLAPFHFVGRSTAATSATFLSTTTSRPVLPDIVSNIFLYFPLGVFLHWTLRRAMRGGVLLLPATVILAAALSGSVECLQAYAPARVSSMIDLVGNIVGATLGASVSFLARRYLPPIVAAALTEFRNRPFAALAKTYAFILVVFAAVPFSFSFDAIRLRQAVRSTNLIPFRTEKIDEALTDGGRAAGDYVARAYLEWRKMKRWSRWATEGVSFAILAWMLLSMLRGDYRFDSGAAIVLTAWLGTGLAVALSMMQFLIITRGCDVTDVLFRLLGLAAGTLTHAVHLREPLTTERRPVHWPRFAKVGCVAAAIYIVYTGLIPLTFDAGRDGPAASLAADGFLPFFGYFVARFDVMMADAIEKFSAYAVFAALAAAGWSSAARTAGWPHVLRIVMAGVVLSVIIETAQMYIPVRVTSLTDPILAATGGLAGALAQQLGARFYRLATSDEASVFPPSGGPADDVSPLDRLVATLFEPFPGAPHERVPGPRHRAIP